MSREPIQELTRAILKNTSRAVVVVLNFDANSEVDLAEAKMVGRWPSSLGVQGDHVSA